MAQETTIPRRLLIRDVTARLLRRLAFIDARALDSQGLSELCSSTLAESVTWLTVDPPSDLDEQDEDDE